MATEYRNFNNVRQSIISSTTDADDCWLLGGPLDGYTDILSAAAVQNPAAPSSLSDTILFPCRVVSADGLQVFYGMAYWKNDSGSYGRVYIDGSLDLSAQTGPNYGFISCVPLTFNAILTNSVQRDARIEFGANLTGELALAFPGSVSRADFSIAIGYNADSRKKGAIALGNKTIAGIPYAMVLSDGVSWPARRANSLLWSASCASAGDSEATLVAGTADHPFVPQETGLYLLSLNIVGRRVSPSPAVWAAKMDVVIDYPQGGSVSIVGSPTPTVIASSGGVTCTASAAVDGSNVRLKVAGNASEESWRWGCSVRGVELINEMFLGYAGE